MVLHLFPITGVVLGGEAARRQMHSDWQQPYEDVSIPPTQKPMMMDGLSYISLSHFVARRAGKGTALELCR